MAVLVRRSRSTLRLSGTFGRTVTLALTLALSLALLHWMTTDGVVDSGRRDQRSAGAQQPVTSRCSQVYRLGSVMHRHEKPPPAGTVSCAIPTLDRRQLMDCAADLARGRGRPVSLLFVGDSRLRMLFGTAAAELNMTLPPARGEMAKDWTKGIRLNSTPEQWCQISPRRSCSLRAHSVWAAVEFLWRPHWNEHMVATLEAVARRCGEAAACPDTVVVNGALWYSRTLLPSHLKEAEVKLILLLREHLSRARPALARLSRLTRTLWKLDERIMFELKGLLSGGLSMLPVAHALVYDLAAQMEDLVIWSSPLPESTEFFWLICLPLLERLKEPLVLQVFYEQCAKDVLHSSEGVRRRAVHALFADLCSGLAQVAPPEQPPGLQGALAYPPCCA